MFVFSVRACLRSDISRDPPDVDVVVVVVVVVILGVVVVHSTAVRVFQSKSG